MSRNKEMDAILSRIVNNNNFDFIIKLEAILIQESARFDDIKSQRQGMKMKANETILFI